MAKKEEWKDVKGWEDRYQVSSIGRVRSKITDHILTPSKKENGYLQTNFYRDAHRKTYLIHRLVAEAFVENPDKKDMVDHINGIRSDNRVENLRWVTGRENSISSTGRPIKCVETGIVFPSLTVAAEWAFNNLRTKANSAHSVATVLSVAASGRYKTAYNYHWKYVEDDMGKMSREKGKRGEREVANILKEYGYDAKRGVQYQGSPDSPDVIGLPGVHLEVKRTERFDLYGAMDQAMRDMAQDDSEIPVVVHRRNGMDWVAVLPFREFLELYGKAVDAHAEMGYEDALILLDEMGLSERTCHNLSRDFAVFHCSECGYFERDCACARYCPECGARVVSE